MSEAPSPDAPLVASRGRLWTAVVDRLSDHPLDFEEEKRRVLYAILVVVAGTMFLLFGLYHLVRGPRSEGVADVLMALFMAGSLAILRRRSDGTVIYRLSIALIGVVFVFFGLVAEPTAGRVLWVFAYPAFALLMGGMVFGAALSVLLLVAWCGILFLLPEMTSVAATPRGFAVRFVASYCTLFLLALFAERVRQIYFDALARHQEQLQRDKVALQAAEERMREMAHRDELTGIANRRSILNILGAELEAARKGREPLAIALLDLDHFKAVNDTHGHAAGDRVLVEMARRLGTHVRARDSLGRYGGEEFVIVFPGATPEVAIRIVERILRTAGRTPVEVDGVSIRTTVSAGVAATDAGELSVRALLERADQALYAAKAAGRDRVFHLPG